jgi:hypothetical protein
MLSHKNDEGKPFVVSQALEPHELHPATYATMRQGLKQRLQTSPPIRACVMVYR